MKATIERSADVKEVFSVGDLVEYRDDDCQYIVVVTDPCTTGFSMRTFKGTVIQSSYELRTVGLEADCTTSDFTLFKGKLILEN